MKRKNNVRLAFCIIVLSIVLSTIGRHHICCAEETREIVFKVGGMTCISCNVAVKTALKKLPGVVKAAADYKSGRAEARYISEKVTPKQMIEAVNKIGQYKASVHNSEKPVLLYRKETKSRWQKLKSYITNW